MRMVFVIGLAVVIAVVFACKNKEINLGGLHLPGGQADGLAAPVMGRWNDAGGGVDYIRFAENGYFRSIISGKLQEGNYTVLEGGAIEFTTSDQTYNPFTNKNVVRKDVKEVQYTVYQGILKLRMDGVWIAFKKATDAPDTAPSGLLVSPK